MCEARSSGREQMIDAVFSVDQIRILLTIELKKDTVEGVIRRRFDHPTVIVEFNEHDLHFVSVDVHLGKIGDARKKNIEEAAQKCLVDVVGILRNQNIDVV